MSAEYFDCSFKKVDEKTRRYKISISEYKTGLGTKQSLNKKLMVVCNDAFNDYTLYRKDVWDNINKTMTTLLHLSKNFPSPTPF